MQLRIYRQSVQIALFDILQRKRFSKVDIGYSDIHITILDPAAQKSVKDERLQIKRRDVVYPPFQFSISVCIYPKGKPPALQYFVRIMPTSNCQSNFEFKDK